MNGDSTMTDVTADWKIHKAVDGTDDGHCAICGQHIKAVPGGDGMTWVHSDTQVVVAPNPPGVTTENIGRHVDKPLNDIMEIDHVVRVHRDGQITSGNIGAPTEPDVLDGDLASSDGPWSLMRGYSGQELRNRAENAVLHNSEFIGGGLERDIRAVPGLYVALVMHWSPTCTECDQDAGFEENEVSHHFDADGNVDHEKDADHVALIPEDDVEGWVVAYIHDDPYLDIPLSDASPVLRRILVDLAEKHIDNHGRPCCDAETTLRDWVESRLYPA